MDSITDAVRRQERRYSNGEDRPLRSYGAILGIYGLTVGTGIALARLAGKRPPDLSLWDVALMTVTTHKLSRMVAKDPVTSPIRAPFTRYEGVSGPSELEEEVRGTGIRHALGELLSCPFCLAQWIGTAYVGGLTFAPRMTRLAGTTVTAVTGADWLQLVYSRLQKMTQD
jgi:hypothetical protein